MVRPRRRRGRAWTERKPAATASGAKRGQQRVGRGQVDVDHGLAAGETVEAGALVGLQLVELEDPHGLRGRRHDLERTTRRSQHDPGGSDVDDLDAAVNETAEEIDHVEVLDQVVGQFDQGADHQVLVHDRHSQNSESSALRGLGRRATYFLSSHLSTRAWFMAPRAS